jgi:hypothetical protein
MAVDVIMKIVPGGAQAVNGAEASKLERFEGRELSVRLSSPRNLAFHRKFFSLLHVGLEMCDTQFTAEQFRAICVTGSGWADYIEHGGRMIAIPRSISFASMGEEEFENLYSGVLSFICSNWAVDENTINQVLEFM